MQGEPEPLLEKFMVGINTVGKGRRQGDKAGLGAGSGGGAASPHPHHRARNELPTTGFILGSCSQEGKGRKDSCP